MIKYGADNPFPSALLPVMVDQPIRSNSTGTRHITSVRLIKKKTNDFLSSYFSKNCEGWELKTYTVKKRTTCIKHTNQVCSLLSLTCMM